jgi:Protein of unknown function (DUF1761)
MHHLESVNVFAVLVAALAGFVIGGSWYGPLFGKPWMAASGMTREKGAEGNMALTFGLAFVFNAIIAVGISMLLDGHRGLLFGLHEGLAAGFFFVATSLGVIYLFERRPLKHYVINAGYQLVNFAAIGMIVGLWPSVKSVTP